MIFSLVGLVAMTAASPVAIPKRNVATAASTVDDLMSQVQAITAQISTFNDPSVLSCNGVCAN